MKALINRGLGGRSFPHIAAVDAERPLAGLLEIITDTLKKGDSVSFPRFGSFEVQNRSALAGRNPKTGEELKIAAFKTVAFKTGAALKAAVNGGKK
jgi:DNA-binding protein HU-beta